MLKLEAPAEYYQERAMGTKMQGENRVHYREADHIAMSMRMAQPNYRHHNGVSSSQVDTVVHGIMNTHLRDNVPPMEYRHDNCQQCHTSPLDNPAAQVQIIQKLIDFQGRQALDAEKARPGSDNASLSGDSDGPRTISPMSVGSISRGNSFSHGSRTIHSQSASPAPSITSQASSGEDIKSSKLYSMLCAPKAGSNTSINDYPYPSVASAAAGVGPYISTPPSFQRPSSRSNSFSHAARPRNNMYPSGMSSSLVRHVREKTCYTPPPDEAQQDYNNFRKRSYSATVPRSRLHDERPIDLSCKRPRTKHLELPEATNGRPLNGSHPCSPVSSNGDDDKRPPELLLKLLCGGPRQNPEVIQQNNQSSTPPHATVTLAKKNVHPTSARINDWLVKLVDFASNLPDFSTLSHDDKLTLLVGSWSRIILLFMAENKFDFVVTSSRTEGTDSPGSPTGAKEDATIPTHKRAESVKSYIHKCSSMNLDAEEYTCLRLMTLFSSGSKVSCTEYVDRMNAGVRQRLQEYVASSQDSRRKSIRYSQLLLLLPPLYNINASMMENLFCRHLTNNVNLNQLLNELIAKA